MASLKEICAKYEVTPRTLRYYEYIELLAPERKGRQRIYGAKEEARLKLILNGRRFGFPLEKIRQWLELYNTDTKNRTQKEAWVRLATEQITTLENRQKDLEEAIAEMTRLRDEYAAQLSKEG